MGQAAKRKTAVMLVHGTVPRLGPLRLGSAPTWHKPNSSFSLALAEALGGETEFRSFDWSGRNSHRERLSAARRLANELSEYAASDDSAEHVIVAHSHGGNVALYALREIPSERQMKFRVVCLGTPFMHAVARDVKEVADVLTLSFGIPVAAVTIPWLLWFGTLASFDRPYFRATFSPTSRVLVFAVPLMLLFAAYWLLMSLRTWCRTWEERAP